MNPGVTTIRQETVSVLQAALGGGYTVYDSRTEDSPIPADSLPAVVVSTDDDTLTGGNIHEVEATIQIDLLIGATVADLADRDANLAAARDSFEAAVLTALFQAPTWVALHDANKTRTTRARGEQAGTNARRAMSRLLLRVQFALETWPVVADLLDLVSSVIVVGGDDTQNIELEVAA